MVAVAPDPALGAIRGFIAELAAAPASVSFDMRLHQTTAAVERELTLAYPRLVPAAGGAFSWTVLRSESERRVAESKLRLAGSEIPFPVGTAAAAPTERVDLVRTVLARVAGRGGNTTWEEGIVVSLRPFGRRADGRLELDLAAQARWFDRGRAGSPPSSWWGEIATPLGRGESLLIVGARSPFAASADADRLVLLLRGPE